MQEGAEEHKRKESERKDFFFPSSARLQLLWESLTYQDQHFHATSALRVY